ncbi:CsbD family protein [Kitasatospora sp. NPDC052896]|uniref:CsbD family protein n=1 Tax=Kitasatospora sp. NPDC052896 TaxID=3364061 RepID=UPI0037C9B1E6
MNTHDRHRNTRDKVKGLIKEYAGMVTGSERLRAEGAADQAKGDRRRDGRHVKDSFKP